MRELGRVAYSTGRGSGLHFQDYRADGTTPPDDLSASSSVRLCAQCHRDRGEGGGGPARINLEAHVIEVGALFSDSVCFDCHRPHDPRP